MLEPNNPRGDGETAGRVQQPTKDEKKPKDDTTSTTGEGTEATEQPPQ